MVHIGQSRPDHGHGFQVKVIHGFEIHSWLSVKSQLLEVLFPLRSEEDAEPPPFHSSGMLWVD